MAEKKGLILQSGSPKEEPKKWETEASDSLTSLQIYHWRGSLLQHHNYCSPHCTQSEIRVNRKSLLKKAHFFYYIIFPSNAQ